MERKKKARPGPITPAVHCVGPVGPVVEKHVTVAATRIEQWLERVKPGTAHGFTFYRLFTVSLRGKKTLH